MSKKPYQPGDPGAVAAQADEGRWTVVFVRDLDHAPERVWSALTDPAALREWAPFDPDRDLGLTGRAILTMAGAEGNAVDERLACEVQRAEAPKLLEYTWGEDLLRWELEPVASGTRLTLRHTMSDKSWLPKVTAGWHICLDVADLWLKGAPIGRIVAGDAMNYGWQRLNDAYAERLGIGSA